MRHERKLYLRILLVIVLGMTAAMGLIRLFTYANNASGEQFLGRVVEAREALPKIVEEDGDIVMVFGSSMVEAGFSARQFEREINAQGGDVSAWNFGFGGLNPYFQDYLSRRIREAFQAEDRRMRLALIEFNPFQTTQARWNGALPVIDSFITMLASDEELLEMALEDPERGALLFNIKYFRDNVSAEMITTFFGRAFRERPQVSDKPRPSEDTQERIDELGSLLNERFEEDYPDWEEARWSYEWQGAGTIPEERSPETLELFREWYAINSYPRRMENDLLNRIRTADILELRFEELLVEHFINVVDNFKQVSDEVEIILLPRNTEWVQYTPEARERLDRVVARIERETGVTVRDHQDLDVIDPSMFGDTTHLARYLGDVPYTEYLIEQYGERLIKGE